MLEEKIASQEERILNISKGLESLQGHRDERDKIIIEQFKMLKKSLNRRADIMTARLEEQGYLSKVVSRKKDGKKQSITLLQPQKKQEPDPAPIDLD